MRKHSKLLFALLITMPFVFCACGKSDVSDDVANISEAEQKEPPQQLVIKDLSDAWDKILNSSTREFIGGHPIDEGFLSLVTATYGDYVIEEIASYANFETADIWYELTGKSIHVLWYEYCRDTGIQNYELDNTYVFDSSLDDEVVLDFTGDLTLAEDMGTTIYMDSQMNGILDCFSSKLITEMHSADIFMVNNEFAYTNGGAALEGKAYTFRANPNRVPLLNELGVDVVGIANNHVYDYDEEGFIDTLETLENASVPYVGAGRNLDEASTPIYIISGGRKIAIVAATQIERTLSYTKEATENSPGVLKCLYPNTFVKEIKKAKKNADIVIVFVHWGTEGTSHYGNDQVSLAKKFVEAGADAIIGGHTHCLQTVEYIDDVPVFYSLGNFFFSVNSSMPADYSTGIAQIRISKEGTVNAVFLPCGFSKGVVSLYSKEDDAYGDIIKNLNELSQSAVIADDGRITKK